MWITKTLFHKVQEMEVLLVNKIEAQLQFQTQTYSNFIFEL